MAVLEEINGDNVILQSGCADRVGGNGSSVLIRRHHLQLDGAPSVGATRSIVQLSALHLAGTVHLAFDDHRLALIDAVGRRV